MTEELADRGWKGPNFYHSVVWTSYFNNLTYKGNSAWRKIIFKVFPTATFVRCENILIFMCQNISKQIFIRFVMKFVFVCSWKLIFSIPFFRDEGEKKFSRTTSVLNILFALSKERAVSCSENVKASAEP